MFEVTFNFTTTEANQNIFTDIIVPKLNAYFGYTNRTIDAGLYLYMDILFDSDYTQNIVINGKEAIKAWAKTTTSFDGFVTSVVLEGNNTTGQIRLRF